MVADPTCRGFPGSLGETEHAIHWLHEASLKGQRLADELLESLVLPV